MLRWFASNLLVAMAVVSFATLLPFSAAHADMIPSTPASVPASDDGGAREIVAQHLAEQGLDQAAIQSRLAELTPSDVVVLAANPDQMNTAAGSPVALIAVICGVVVLVAILVLDSMKAKEDEQYRTY